MKTKKLLLVAVAGLAATLSAKAAEPVKVDIGTDLVSNYLWRGSKLDGPAIQPGLNLEWGCLTAGVWGSTGLTGDAREIDFSLGATFGGFTIGVTDYFCADSTTPFFDFGSTTPHVVELGIGYDLGVVAFNWYTNALGAVGLNSDGDPVYASYVEVSAPFSFGGLEWTAALGATPWGSDYYDAESFALINCSLKAEKELELGSATLPVFAQVMANPSAGAMFFAVGISF